MNVSDLKNSLAVDVFIEKALAFGDHFENHSVPVILCNAHAHTWDNKSGAPHSKYLQIFIEIYFNTIF